MPAIAYGSLSRRTYSGKAEQIGCCASLNSGIVFGIGCACDKTAALPPNVIGPNPVD